MLQSVVDSVVDCRIIPVMNNSKRYRLKHADRIKADAALWRARSAHKRKAHRVLARAVKNKHIIKPDACNRCCKPGQLNAHHSDYSKPLDVIWVCRSCHAWIHGGVCVGVAKNRPRGEAHPKAKLNGKQVLEIYVAVSQGESKRATARKYEVSEGLVRQICVGKIWKHLTNHSTK